MLRIPPYIKALSNQLSAISYQSLHLIDFDELLRADG
jgi:hypothetical protein